MNPLIALVLILGACGAPTTPTDEFPEVPILPEAAYLDPDLCVPVVLDDSATPEAIDYLTGTGWTGNPDDGMEALYAPGCNEEDE